MFFVFRAHDHLKDGELFILRQSRISTKNNFTRTFSPRRLTWNQSCTIAVLVRVRIFVETELRVYSTHDSSTPALRTTHLTFSGAVRHSAAALTSLLASISPNPNAGLTRSPAPFTVHPGLFSSGNGSALQATMCFRSRQVSSGLINKHPMNSHK